MRKYSNLMTTEQRFKLTKNNEIDIQMLKRSKLLIISRSNLELYVEDMKHGIVTC